MGGRRKKCLQAVVSIKLFNSRWGYLDPQNFSHPPYTFKDPAIHLTDQIEQMIPTGNQKTKRSVCAKENRSLYACAESKLPARLRIGEYSYMFVAGLDRRVGSEHDFRDGGVRIRCFSSRDRFAG